ncbi:MAG: DNA polymerase IV [Deltaproteobacteria bacterium]|nr:DNA polymerase IV [Deltaproteobacteria bacterium]
MPRHIIHFHVPALPIAVARISRPELRYRPVAMAAGRSGRSLVLSVSREARSEGVFKGMSLQKARTCCPGLTILSPDPRAAEQACRELARVAARYTPRYEPCGPGHMYLDLTGTERLWGKARDAACRLRNEIRERLGLMGTAGVAGNKMVSSIASRTVPSEGVLNVDHGREAGFMAPLKVGLMPGIGPVRRKLLAEELNIVRIRQLAALDLNRLALIFGRQAYMIHERALGIDPTPVYPLSRVPVIAEVITLPQEEVDDPRLLGYLYRLVETCGRRMRKQGLIPRKAGLRIRYADHVETGGRLKLPRPGFQDHDLYAPLEALFFKQCTRRVRVGFIKAWFWEFSRPDPQLTLFDAPSPDEERRSVLTRTLDRIRDRYGENGIMYGKSKA